MQVVHIRWLRQPVSDSVSRVNDVALPERRETSQVKNTVNVVPVHDCNRSHTPETTVLTTEVDIGKRKKNV